MENLDLPFVDLSIIEQNKIQNKRFGDFYEEACDRVRKNQTLGDIMKDFEELKSDLAVVKYVYQMEDSKKLFISAMEGKNEEIAFEMEEEYDLLIKNETLASTAQITISKSIQATPNEDKNALSRRYMKRGWASLLQEHFEFALLDAQRSLSFGTSLRLIWNSLEILGHCYAKQNLCKKSESFFKQAIEGLRSSECSQEIKATTTMRISTVLKTVKGRKDIKTKNKANNDINESINVPAVSYGRNKILESASSAVQVGETNEMGRCIFATKDIKPGDFIIVEEPFISSLNYDCLETHCTNCFRRVETPLPCTTCSQIWFCGEKCLKEGSELHSGECKILSLIYDECIGKMAVIVYRILQKATLSKLKSIRNLVSEPDSSATTETKKKPATETLRGKAGKYSTHDYFSTYHLVTNSNKRTFGDIFKRALIAIYIGKCLQATNFFGPEDTEEEILYVISLALRHLQGSACNAYGITEYVEQDDDPKNADLIELGGAIYPTISLTNHSCYPNTIRYSVGKSCVLRATRTIPKGSQVLDNYDSDFYAVSQKDRQGVLESQYKFKCACEACAGEWSLYPHEHKFFTFECPASNCRTLSIYAEGRTLSCPGCGEKTEPYQTLVNEIKINVNEFGKGLLLQNKGKLGQALPVFLYFQMFLDRYAKPPGKCLTDSQMSIKRAFIAQGNTFRYKKR